MMMFSLTDPNKNSSTNQIIIQDENIKNRLYLWFGVPNQDEGELLSHLQVFFKQMGFLKDDSIMIEQYHKENNTISFRPSKSSECTYFSFCWVDIKNYPCFKVTFKDHEDVYEYRAFHDKKGFSCDKLAGDVFHLFSSSYFQGANRVVVTYGFPDICFLDILGADYKILVHFSYPKDCKQKEDGLRALKLIQSLLNQPLNVPLLNVYQQIRTYMPMPLKDYGRIQLTLFQNTKQKDYLGQEAYQMIENIVLQHGKMNAFTIQNYGRRYSFDGQRLSLDVNDLHIVKCPDGSFSYSYHFKDQRDIAMGLHLMDEIEMFSEEMERSLKKVRYLVEKENTMED